MDTGGTSDARDTCIPTPTLLCRGGAEVAYGPGFALMLAAWLLSLGGVWAQYSWLASGRESYSSLPSTATKPEQPTSGGDTSAAGVASRV